MVAGRRASSSPPQETLWHVNVGHSDLHRVVAAGKASALRSSLLARPRAPSRDAAQSRVVAVDACRVRRRGRGRPVRPHRVRGGRGGRARGAAQTRHAWPICRCSRAALSTGACPSEAYHTTDACAALRSSRDCRVRAHASAVCHSGPAYRKRCVWSAQLACVVRLLHVRRGARPTLSSRPRTTREKKKHINRSPVRPSVCSVSRFFLP